MTKACHPFNLNYVLASLLFTGGLAPNLALSATTSPWQGPYLGVYAGGGFGHNHTSTNVGGVTSTSYFTTSANIGAVNNAATSTNTPSSIVGGIEAGHDWAWKEVVYGLILDYGALPFSSSEGVKNMLYPDNANAYSVSTSVNSNWLFTLRGRLGYSLPLRWSTLLYLTGGMAMTQLSVKNNFNDNSDLSGAGGGAISENKIGWTAGVGVELLSYKRISIDLEYLYIHIPSVNVTSSISNTQGGFGIPVQSLTSPFTTTGQFYANLLKIGINYRFDE